MPADHPISWCQNYDGGRAYTQALGHLRERWYDASFLQTCCAASSGPPAPCRRTASRIREVRELVAAQKAAGTLTAAAADRATALHQQRLHVLRAAREELRGGRDRHRRAADARPAARERRRHRPRSCSPRPTSCARGCSPSAPTRETRRQSAARCRPRCRLTLGPAPSFGAFTPALAKDYETTRTATVTSTAGDATLSVSNPGYLANGAYTLAEPLRVGFSKSVWTGPVSNDNVTIAFKQLIKATDPLRTGSYSKSVTFTLSTTTP